MRTFWRKNLTSVMAFCLIVGSLLTTGCQVWNSSGSIPGLNNWSKDLTYAKQAKNDPFPSPEQVGLK
jgi:hypothetical protein